MFGFPILETIIRFTPPLEYNHIERILYAGNKQGNMAKYEPSYSDVIPFSSISIQRLKAKINHILPLLKGSAFTIILHACFFLSVLLFLLLVLDLVISSFVYIALSHVTVISRDCVESVSHFPRVNWVQRTHGRNVNFISFNYFKIKMCLGMCLMHAIAFCKCTNLRKVK